MATNIPTRHVYKEDNQKQYKSVKHYRLVEVINGNRQLSELINISKDRNFSKAINITYWLKERNVNGKKWNSPLTGLKPTSKPFEYHGDIPIKKGKRFIPNDLLRFKFSDNMETLTIDLYPNYYTNKG